MYIISKNFYKRLSKLNLKKRRALRLLRQKTRRRRNLEVPQRIYLLKAFKESKSPENYWSYSCFLIEWKNSRLLNRRLKIIWLKETKRSSKKYFHNQKIGLISNNSNNNK